MLVTSRRRARLVVSLAMVAPLVAVGLVSSAGGATADTANDPLAATTYHQNPAHDGGYQDASFAAPLQRSWSVDLGGTVGYPVIADGRVFVTVAHTPGYGDDVEALSLATGAVVWGPKSIGGTYWTGMLAYDAGRVFAVNHDGLMAAFDAATGAQQWITQLPGQWAFTSAPTAVGGSVYVGGAGSGGTLYSVDEGTGDVSWTASVMNGDDSSPAVGDGGVYVSYACEQAYKFALDGTPLWHHATGCEGGGGRTSVLHGGDLYVRDDAGMAPAVLDDSTGALLGTFSSDVAPAFDGSMMATESGGVLQMWDATSGDRLWQTTTTDNVTAPVIANGLVIEGRDNGTVDVRSELDGSLVWSGSAGTEILPTDEHNAHPLVGLAVGDGTLVVPAGDQLTAFVPGDEPIVQITDGPTEGQLVGPHTSFTFTSNVQDATYTCTMDGTSAPCTSPVEYSQLTDGTHTFTVGLDGSNASAGPRSFRVDATPPTVRLHAFTPLATTAPTVTSRWRGADASGVAEYQLRLRQRRPGTALVAWSPLSPSPATSAVLAVRPGAKLCVEVRARDLVGNWSSWTTAQCVLRERRRP